MNMLTLLKKLIPGFIPLFAYIAIESIYGETIGLIAGITIGVLEFAFSFFQTKKLDFFILLDTLLLLVLGLISIAFSNPIFYKIKPAIIEILCVLPLLISGLGSGKWLMKQMEHVVKGIELPPLALNKMKRTSLLMAFIFFLHSVLTLLSAFFASDAVWAFVSGSFLFILIIPVLALQFLKPIIAKRTQYILKPESKYVFLNSNNLERKTKIGSDKKEEILPIINENLVVIGKEKRSACHEGNKVLVHPVIHLHIINSKGKIALQKRSKNKVVAPLLWDTAVGGHIAYKESIESALFSEAREEIGLVLKEAHLICSYLWESALEREIVFVYATKTDEVLSPDLEEVDEVNYFSHAEIKELLREEKTSENFAFEYRSFLSKL